MSCTAGGASRNCGRTSCGTGRLCSNADPGYPAGGRGAGGAGGTACGNRSGIGAVRFHVGSTRGTGGGATGSRSWTGVCPYRTGGWSSGPDHDGGGAGAAPTLGVSSPADAS